MFENIVLMFANFWTPKLLLDARSSFGATGFCSLQPHAYVSTTVFFWCHLQCEVWWVKTTYSKILELY